MFQGRARDYCTSVCTAEADIRAENIAMPCIFEIPVQIYGCGLVLRGSVPSKHRCIPLRFLGFPARYLARAWNRCWVAQCQYQTNPHQNIGTATLSHRVLLSDSMRKLGS